MTDLKPIKWAMLLWNPKTRKARLLGFVVATEWGRAHMKMSEKYDDAKRDRNYFLRPASKNDPMWYGRLALDTTPTND